MRKGSNFGVLILLLSFSACINLKNAPQQEEIVDGNAALENVQVPQDWIFQELTDSPELEMGWAAEWQTAALVDLVKETLIYNADLQVAQSRVEASQQGLTIARSRMLPLIGGMANYSREFVNSANTALGLGSISWEADLWGKLRYGKKGAETNILAQSYAQEKMQQVIAAAVGKAYYTAICLNLQ
ncbi:TolC family protein [Persicobacter diffluens]|uniref:Uncharacterized protein n=1 Tax=Persicobacter diffluens TaxID=981 RepID=A0AAN5ANZ6_9BACT|nr:hypothetical protein PEDI_43730 [Persicobacter diffluens]